MSTPCVPARVVNAQIACRILALISNNNRLLLTSFTQLDYCFSALGKKKSLISTTINCGADKHIPDDGFPYIVVL